MRVWNSDTGRDDPVEELGRPEVLIDYLPGTREMRGATVTVDDPDGKTISVRNTPLRTLYLAAGSGYVNLDGWGHGVYQGPLKVGGLRWDTTDPEFRSRFGFVTDTAARFTLDGRVGYGLFELMILGVYRPYGFTGWDTVAP